jgi:hypothetical protein
VADCCSFQQTFNFDDTPQKKSKSKKPRKSSAASGDSEGWEAASAASDLSDSPSTISDEFLGPKQKRKDKVPRIASEEDKCGLCKDDHPPGVCKMADSSENLAKYRDLLFEPSDEPFEERVRTLISEHHGVISRDFSARRNSRH